MGLGIDPAVDLSPYNALVGTEPDRFGIDPEPWRVEGENRVLADPISYSLYTESNILDMNIGHIMLQDAGSGITLQFDIQSSDDGMQTWLLEETILRDVDMSGEKVFLRLDYGPKKTTP